MKSKEFIVLNFTFLFLAQLQNYFRKVKYFIFDKKKGYLLYVLQFIFFQSFIIFAYLLYCFNSHTIVFFLLWRKPLCKHNRYSERILSWCEKSMITFKKHSCSLFNCALLAYHFQLSQDYFFSSRVVTSNTQGSGFRLCA